jgi:hypothetical protein
MPASAVARTRTRAFARVIGPILVIVPGIVFVQAPDMRLYLTSFFANPALVFITAAIMLFAGVLVVANHQYWSSPTAIFISLFGWFVVLRALALLLFPKQYEALGLGPGAVLLGRSVFGVIVLIGLWLTWAGWIAKPPRETA